MYSSCRGLHSPKLLRALFARSELTVSDRDAGDAYQDCVCWHHRGKEKECRMMQVQPKAKDEIQFTVLHHDRITFASVPTLQCHGKKYLSKCNHGEAQTYNILLHSVDKLPKNKNETKRRRFKFDGNLSLTVFEPTWNSQERVVRVGDKTLMTMKALKHLNNYIFKEKKAHPSMCSSLHLNVQKSLIDSFNTLIVSQRCSGERPGGSIRNTRSGDAGGEGEYAESANDKGWKAAQATPPRQFHNAVQPSGIGGRGEIIECPTQQQSGHLSCSLVLSLGTDCAYVYECVPMVCKDARE